jgi:thioredoxin 1
MANNSYTIELDDQNFERLVFQEKQLFLVDFWADWCGPCKTLSPFIERLATDFHGDIAVGKLNVDQNPQISSSLQIRSLPTLILFQGDHIIFEQFGVPDPQTFVDKMEGALEDFKAQS